jgi:hypothetical protein
MYELSMSQKSNWAMGWMTGDLGFDSWHKGEIFLFTIFRPTLGFTNLVKTFVLINIYWVKYMLYLKCMQKHV